MTRLRFTLAVAVTLLAAACSERTAPPSAPQLHGLSASEGQGDQQEALDHAIIHRTVEAAANARGEAHRSGGSVELAYGGGAGGIGVQTAPRIILVLWGSQWNGNDPSGEAAILQSFYGGVGGSSWLNSVTQYCQGVPAGTVFCNGAGTPAGNQSGLLAAVWSDNAAAAPSRPRQSDLAAEALRAAQHFGNLTAASNANVQYVIATATGNGSSGFKTQYCAYHSSTSAAGLGNVAYTNMPYITDAGASCGANFNGLGPKAGITIVSGHEAAESISDPFPNTGWLDRNGAENGDKCAWIPTGSTGAAQDIVLGTGTFAVQSLWSNAAAGNTGGCVVSYP